MAPPDRRSRTDSHVVILFSRDLDIGFGAVSIELQTSPFSWHYSLRVSQLESTAISGSSTQNMASKTAPSRGVDLKSAGHPNQT
jgi:hypothetical protein